MGLIHIVFGQSSIPALEAAIALDAQMEGTVICFEDDLSVGPLFMLDTKEGRADRYQFQQQLAGIEPQPVTGNEETSVSQQRLDDPDDTDQFKNLLAQLKADPEQQVWIWAGQNARDVCGYYWLVSQLYDFAGRIYIIYLNNLPFLNDKGAIFYPTHLHQILPKEFLKARKLARVISLAEFELDGDEWQRLMNENAAIRLLEGGKKVKGAPVLFYDKDLLSLAGKEFVKAWRIVQQMTGKLKYPIMDQFLGWRLKEMIRQGSLQSKGELKTIRDFEVSLPVNNTDNPIIA